MKLLGLLPIVSIVGLFALDKSQLKSAGEIVPNEIVAYVGLFAAMFTIALFIYEMRGILMCHDLMSRGKALERLMKVTGQFDVCGEQRLLPCYDGEWKRKMAQQFNAKLAACAIYSLVFAAWLFVALRYGFAVHVRTCALCAVIIGIVLAAGAYLLMHILVKSEGESVPHESLQPAAGAAHQKMIPHN
jgi:hypothetical protein